MEKITKILQSRTVLMSLVTVIAAIASLFGIIINPNDINIIVEAVLAIVTAVSGILAIIFRTNPKSTFKTKDQILSDAKKIIRNAVK